MRGRSVAVLWKDVLWLGKWTTPDGNSLTVRPRDLHGVAANGQRMIATGLGVPWCWDHQPDALPVEMSSSVYRDLDRRAGATRNIITPKTVGFRVAEVNGRPTVLAGLDTTGLPAEEVDRIRRAGAVSCRIDRGFWDARGNGTKYSGLNISHIAVTPKPLEPNQGPFFMSAVRCSDETFLLGHAAMAKDTDEPDDDGIPAIDPSELDDDDIVPLTEAPFAPPVPAGPPPADPYIQSIIGSASAFGANIPNDGSVNDTQTLALAFKIAASMKKPDTPQDDAMNAAPTPEQGPSPPMMMSQAAMAELDPEKVKKHRSGLEKRIHRLFRNGQIDGPTCGNMLNKMKAFQLSYAGQNIVQTGLVATVLGIEQTVRKGTFLAPKQGERGFEMGQGGFTEVPLPAEFDSGNESPEARKQRATFIETIERNNPK